MERTWREVRRRKVVIPPVRSWDRDASVTSFFVANLPGDATRDELWEPCSKLGKLVDVYIAGRRNVAGMFFDFIRFKDVVNSVEVERGLNEVSCRGRKLSANCAKHPRIVSKAMPRKVQMPAPNRVPPAAKDSRTFVDVMKGKEVQKNPTEM
ncbi:hypothetical protein LXL04_030986 [Taraxacum kok-saghyz]